MRALASGVSRLWAGTSTPAPPTADGGPQPLASAALGSGAPARREDTWAEAGLPRAREQTPPRGRRETVPAPQRRSPRGHPPAGAGDGQHGGAELLPPGGAPRVLGSDAGEGDKWGNPRSIAKMRVGDEKRGVPDWPTDAPAGPWDSVTAAKSAIDAWAVVRPSGGFAVVKSTTRDGVGEPGTAGRWDRGRRQVLECHDRKTGCKWGVTLEHCNEGWAVYRFSAHPGTENGHNHSLTTSLQEALTRPTMRNVPPELVETGKELYREGMGAAHIFRWMRSHVTAEGKTAHFHVRDVEYAVGATTGEKRFDATNLVERLRQREVDQGLFHRVQTNGEGQLTHVFMQAAGSHAIYANEVERQVVEIDTKVRAHIMPCAHATTLTPRPPFTARHQQAWLEAHALGDGGWHRRDQGAGQQPPAG